VNILVKENIVMPKSILRKTVVYQDPEASDNILPPSNNLPMIKAKEELKNAARKGGKSRNRSVLGSSN